MGYTTRPGTQITDYWPDDTEDTIYISTSIGISLKELTEKIDEKWPGSSSDNIQIEAQKIHTHCIYYDLYDSSDYTDFLVITKSKGA